ncbi:Tetratricopeptide-like helical domain superfamily [Sesbania bispinosa]|nr:Tetratricopeptide-like helical domain superfamily [Sesbania bispinosa]
MASLRFPISLDAFDSKSSIPSLSTCLHANGACPFKSSLEPNPNPKPQVRSSKRVWKPNREIGTDLKFSYAAKNSAPPNTEQIPTRDADVDFSSFGVELSTEQCNAILKRLESDDVRTLSFFEWMRKNGKLERNADAYNVAARALSKREDWEGAEKLVREMSANFGSEMNFRVFNTLIYACSKRGLVELGAKWFRIMLDCGVAPNTATFGMLMGLYRKGWNVEEAEFAMSHMRQFGIVCESANSSMITIYTRLGLFEKAEEVIELMKKEEVVLNLENWLVMLNAYCQQGKMGDAEGVLVSMQEAGFCPNVVAYNTMITGYGKASNMDAAQKLFLRMQHSVGVDPDETTYRSMIEGWGRADNYEQAKQARWYYKELKRLGYKPNSSNLFTMIKLQAKHGDEEGAIGTLDDMVHCGCQYSSVVGTLLHVYESAGRVYKVPFLLKGSFYQHVLVNQSSCSTVVMAYVKHRLVDDAMKVLSDKKWQDPRYEDNLYHLLICSCKEAGLLEDAVRIYNQMAKDDDKPNKHIMCTMIDIYSVMGLFKDAEKLYLELKSSGVSLDMIAYSIVVRMYVKAGSLKDACSVLDDMEKRPDIVPDNFLLRDMLRIYQRCNMVDKLADLYYKISKDRMNWDQELYNCALNCCAQALPVDELSRVFEEMVQRGFVPNTITYNVMLDVFGKAKLFKKVWRLYCMAKKQGLVDVITYNTIIAAYGKNKDFKNMTSTVQEMQFDGFSVSLEAYNSMLDAYGKDGQMETFRSVLQKMKESNCASDHYTYNTMINIYGEQGWIEEVADVLMEVKECGLRPDLCSYNTLIKAYGIAGMVEDAVGLIKEMRKNGIEPDKITYINLITALRRNDKFLEAVKWSLWMKQMKL